MFIGFDRPSKLPEVSSAPLHIPCLLQRWMCITPTPCHIHTATNTHSKGSLRNRKWDSQGFTFSDSKSPLCSQMETSWSMVWVPWAPPHNFFKGLLPYQERIEISRQGYHLLAFTASIWGWGADFSNTVWNRRDPECCRTDSRFIGGSTHS